MPHASGPCPGPTCYHTVVKAKSDKPKAQKSKEAAGHRGGAAGVKGSYYVAPTEAEWEAYKACREAERSQQNNQKVLDAIKRRRNHLSRVLLWPRALLPLSAPQRLLFALPQSLAS